MTYDTAVVTGAASGIGRALATRLNAVGTRLVLADARAGPLTELATEIGAIAVPTDVSDPTAMRALAEAAPTADLLCLNAGIVGPLGAAWEIDDTEWDRVFAVNVGGVRNGLRAFVPRLLAAGKPAHILITASLAGLTSFPGGGAYGPSKHAVIAMAEQAALELRGRSIGVTVLAPSLVRTGMSDVGEDPLDVADDALAAVRREQFVLTPPQWHREIVRRAERLVSGDQPLPPGPASAE